MTASAGPVLHDLYSAFGGRVAFLTLYVREAHPGDRYVQPQDFDTKLAQVREYATRDDIRWPVAVDDIDGTLHRTLDAKPNAAYVIDADGVVAFRALWTNHSAPLRAALTTAAEGRRGALGESQANATPLLSPPHCSGLLPVAILPDESRAGQVDAELREEPWLADQHLAAAHAGADPGAEM